MVFVVRNLARLYMVIAGSGPPQLMISVARETRLWIKELAVSVRSFNELRTEETCGSEWLRMTQIESDKYVGKKVWTWL